MSLVHVSMCHRPASKIYRPRLNWQSGYRFTREARAPHAALVFALVAAVRDAAGGVVLAPPTVGQGLCPGLPALSPSWLFSPPPPCRSCRSRDWPLHSRGRDRTAFRLGKGCARRAKTALALRAGDCSRGQIAAIVDRDPPANGAAGTLQDDSTPRTRDVNVATGHLQGSPRAHRPDSNAVVRRVHHQGGSAHSQTRGSHLSVARNAEDLDARVCASRRG